MTTQLIIDSLRERVAVVTGGASGIGRSIVDRLVQGGARVAIWDISPERLGECSSTFGDRVLTQEVDVADSAQVNSAMVDLVARCGPPAYLVNNAGIIGRRMLIGEVEAIEVARILSVNLTSVFVTTSAFVRHSKGVPERAIVNMSSTAARTGGMPGTAVYAAAKGAIATLTVSHAKELAPQVRVNALAPGIIDTQIQAAVLGDRAALTSLAAHIPLGRIGEPIEVAEAAVWLLSPGASYVTGAVLTVSGGF
jgi:2-dehydro-3-deoxy-L-rhamnonate dehydrogenase (NAD+)